MAKVKVKLDISKLKEESTFSSRFIESQVDLDGEIGYSEIVDYIMEMINITSAEIVSNEYDEHDI